MPFSTIQKTITPIPQSDYAEVVTLWEAAVRATHHFLQEADILYFKPLILDQYLDLVTLSCLRDTDGKIAAFMGVAEAKVEMLFVHPEVRGQGLGRLLMQHAMDAHQAFEVDVNEQNEQAVGFYKKLGFAILRRSPLDGTGKPYPILHMRYQALKPTNM